MRRAVARFDLLCDFNRFTIEFGGLSRPCLVTALPCLIGGHYIGTLDALGFPISSSTVNDVVVLCGMRPYGRGSDGWSWSGLRP